MPSSGKVLKIYDITGASGCEVRQRVIRACALLPVLGYGDDRGVLINAHAPINDYRGEKRHREEAKRETHHAPSKPPSTPLERRDPRLRAAEDEGVDVVRAFVGVDGLEIHHVADDVIFVDDA